MPGKIADLNVRLGLDLGPFIREINRVERRLRKFERSVESTGRALTTAISIPLAAVGGAAIKAFADFDKLEKGLQAVNGSSREASEQFTRLRKLAENPGIGLEQAIQGAIRLQALNIEAKTAERTLLNLSKAVALTGTAENLDGVVTQLAQIVSKGTVLQQDLRIALENAPALAEALKSAFGTINAEDINKQISGVDDFVEKINQAIEESETFQKVQSSLQNEFVNFGITLKFAAAELGKYIDQTFDVQGNLNRLSDFINRAVDTFKQLDDETRRQIIRFGAFVAAIGPSLLAIAGLTKGLRTIVGIYKTVQVTLVNVTKAIVAQTAVTNAADKSTSGLIGTMTKFKNIQRALVASGGVFLLAAGIGLLVEQFLNVKSKIDSVNDAFQSLSNVQKQAEAETRKEIAGIDQLISRIEKNNITREESVKAIQSLQNKYPGFLSNLDAEKVTVDQLKNARNELNKTILQSARARAAEAKLIGVFEEELEIQERQKKAFEELNRIRLEGIKLGLITSDQSAADLLDKNIKSANDGIELQANQLAELQRQYRKYSEEVKGAADQLGDLYDIQNELVNLASQEVNITPITSGATIAPRQNDGTKKINRVGVSPLQGIAGASPLGFVEDGFAERIAATTEEVRKLSEALPQVQEGFTGMQEVALTAFDAFVNGFDEVLNSAEGFGRGMIKVLGKVAQAAIQAAVSQVILKRLQALGGFLGLAAAPIAAGAGKIAASLFGKLISSIGVPFAKGGIVTGPTNALIGEAGPEAVIPLSPEKLRKYFPDRGSSGPVQIYLNDIMIAEAVQRGQTKLSRIR